ncbi:alpha/beta-hydrolase [Ceraceosorus guamensis]|uniref:Alpha/beta-hydrolase n=1 Tax=Ceraceosorus guamensis TaxID=1522189 RepID=A0A316W625_9BASI|nr:alpha/beta-hydrolase [Ceraceosorus guamensis]PWN44548.1 alpha/beta-hydrolase [Ceraceosorus guamensis]
MPRTQSRISRLVASFLRIVLVPTILFGVPLWPFLGLLCAVPFVGIITIPLFLLLSVLLLYSIAWFSYLLLAQADPPASISASSYLPFLPYSPMRCLKVNWAAFQYATTAVTVVIPAVLDWSYRRVMVLGSKGAEGIVKEGIDYGSQTPGMRLDVYLPPSHATSGSAAQGATAAQTLRTRKHSTLFADAIPPPVEESLNGAARMRGAPVIVFVPPTIPPLTWTNKRKTYLQLALRFRRMGYCVVVPDISYFPAARMRASVIDLRLVLRWVGESCARYGGDPSRIHLMGHGLSAHLALLTLAQEAVVLSREGHMERAFEREMEKRGMMRWDGNASDEDESFGPSAGSPSGRAQQRRTYRLNEQAQNAPAEDAQAETAWVDEPADGDDLPPGAVMGESSAAGGTARLASQLGSLGTPSASRSGASSGEVTFPSAGISSSPMNAQQHAVGREQSLANAEASIPNGLRRVEIYSPDVAIPPIAGLILVSGVSDVIKGFRNESDRGIEHLSVLRRACGPSHTACLLHSPAHLIYAAKNIVDASLFPPKILLIHGGKDSVVDVSQSTLLKTLLVGCGVGSVRLRAYRQLGHAEAIAAMFLGMGKAATRYQKQLLNDIADFVQQ